MVAHARGCAARSPHARRGTGVGVPQVSPLMAVELLHRIVNVLQLYFGAKLRESAVQENFATVYQVCAACVWPCVPAVGPWACWREPDARRRASGHSCWRRC